MGKIVKYHRLDNTLEHIELGIIEFELELTSINFEFFLSQSQITRKPIRFIYTLSVTKIL